MKFSQNPDICSFLLDEKRTKESRAGPSALHTRRALPRRPAHSPRAHPGLVSSFPLLPFSSNVKHLPTSGKAAIKLTQIDLNCLPQKTPARQGIATARPIRKISEISGQYSTSARPHSRSASWRGTKPSKTPIFHPCSFLLDEKRAKESRAGPSALHTWQALSRRPAHSPRAHPGLVSPFPLLPFSSNVKYLPTSGKAATIDPN